MFLLRQPLEVNPMAIRNCAGSGAPNFSNMGAMHRGDIVQPGCAGLVQLSLHGSTRISQGIVDLSRSFRLRSARFSPLTPRSLGRCGDFASWRGLARADYGIFQCLGRRET